MNRKRAKLISLKGVAKTHGEALSLVRVPGDFAIVERGRLRTVVCMCPCGCGSTLTVNLDERAGKAWRLYRRKNGISLYPSVWRDSGCKSHFVVWKNHVLWVDTDWMFDEDQIDKLIPKILPLIPIQMYAHFREIAESIDEIPWAVLRACRKLEKTGKVREGEDKYSGYFIKSVDSKESGSIDFTV